MKIMKNMDPTIAAFPRNLGRSRLWAQVVAAALALAFMTQGVGCGNGGGGGSSHSPDPDPDPEPPPDGKARPIKSVTLNGQDWREFKADKEAILLTGVQGKATIVVYY